MQSKSDNLIKKQSFTGVVVSDKMQNTVVVQVKHTRRHPKYHKSFTVSKRIPAHDETGATIGSTVVIESCRPMSRTKKFKVIKKAS